MYLLTENLQHVIEHNCSWSYNRAAEIEHICFKTSMLEGNCGKKRKIYKY